MNAETKDPNILTVDRIDYLLPPVVMDILNATANERDAALAALAALLGTLEVANVHHDHDLDGPSELPEVTAARALVAKFK